MNKLIALHPDDNIEITAKAIPAGTDLLGNGNALPMDVAGGHKIARTRIMQGAAIRKFAQIIGTAVVDIQAGEHVHSHNCSFSEHSRSVEIGVDLATAQAAIPTIPARTFQGYQREDGAVGTRNYIGLCATVNCSASVIRRAAAEIEASAVLDQYANVDGIAVFAHGTGCGMNAHGAGYDNLERVLWGYATHANVGATLFVGLGCEVMQISRLTQKFGQKHRRFALSIQETGGTRATIDAIKTKVLQLLPEVNQNRRRACCASHLKIGLQCGGSDGYSALTANPALGHAADLVVALGGAVILSETPEIFGAEQLLLRRARNADVADALLSRLRWWEHYVEINGGSMDNNPSPGNKLGGLTTILEKSLGAVAKAGSSPLMAVYNYAEQVTAKGLTFMDTPGYDPVSVTGQIAGGAQLICFTTGRGSAFGSKPAPTIKLATNTALYHAMHGDMDINCGDVLTGESDIQQKGEQILDTLLAVASGQTSKSEEFGMGDDEFVPWQIGAVM